jgi:hypothetical protein
LSLAISHSQQTALEDGAVPANISTAEELERSIELLVKLPPPASSPDSSTCAKTTAPLLPLPCPPSTIRGAADAAAMLQWLAMLPAPDEPAPSSTVYAALAHSEELFYNEALSLHNQGASVSDVQTITELSDLVTAVRNRLRAAAEASAKPFLLVEYRSREALIICITLAAIHRSVAGAWPALRCYSLPINPDDLRLLTLRSAKAEQAALAVAAYFTAHAGPKSQMFTTSAGNATMDLAADYVATGPSSERFRALLDEEAEIASCREDAHWKCVVNKQMQLADLDQRLADAKNAARDAKDKVDDAYRELESAVQRAESQHEEAQNTYDTAQRAHSAEIWRSLLASRKKARRWMYEEVAREWERKKHTMPEYLSLQAAKQTREHVMSDRYAAHVADCTNPIKRSFQSTEGCNWKTAWNTYAAWNQQVSGLEEQITMTEKPPPPVLHPVPNSDSTPRDACTVLFWLYPEHTGLMPHLAMYCFDAQQVRLVFCCMWAVHDAYSFGMRFLHQAPQIASYYS